MGVNTWKESFEDLLRELQKYLRIKLEKKKRSGITPLCLCVNVGYDHFEMLDNLKDFCSQNNYVLEEVEMMIDEYYGCDCHCDCHILQAMEAAGTHPNRRFIGGSLRT